MDDKANNRITFCYIVIIMPVMLKANCIDRMPETVI